MLVKTQNRVVDLSKFDGLAIIPANDGNLSLSVFCRSYVGDRHTLDISLYTTKNALEAEEIMDLITEKWTMGIKYFDLKKWVLKRASGSEGCARLLGD